MSSFIGRNLAFRYVETDEILRSFIASLAFDRRHVTCDRRFQNCFGVLRDDAVEVVTIDRLKRERLKRCADVLDDGADQASYEYIPTTRPGARIPHLWLKDGSAVQDHLRGGYALITCAPCTAGLEKLGEAFRSFRCPFQVMDVSDVTHAREIYARDYVLLRPDLHVAWRGNSAPVDSARLAAVVTGHI